MAAYIGLKRKLHCEGNYSTNFWFPHGAMIKVCQSVVLPSLTELKKKKRKKFLLWDRVKSFQPQKMESLFIHVLLSWKHFHVVVDPARIFKGTNQLRCTLPLWKCQHWAPERPRVVWEGTQLYAPALQRYLPGATRKQEVARRHGSAKHPGPINTDWPVTEGSGNSLQWMHFVKLSISVTIVSYVWTTTFCFLWKVPMK